MVARIRIWAYIQLVLDVAHTASSRRWELYRLLGEPVRLRLLALASAEELAIGELADLLGESQPKVSKHAKTLREAGLLRVRKQGRWAFLQLNDGVASDPVVGDALDAGRALCEEDGSLSRVVSVVRARDAAARAFFDRDAEEAEPGTAGELPAVLTALAPLISPRRLAVDAGTGDGSLLDVLAPIFDRVVALDRAAPQLERARRRVERRAFANVELLAGELDDDALKERVVGELGGADAVFASRVLHHAPKPAMALASLAALARPGGVVLVIDYASHQDERMREHQADLWLGFSEAELRDLAHGAGLVEPQVTLIPSARCGDGPDGHLDWQVLAARTNPGE